MAPPCSNRRRRALAAAITAAAVLSSSAFVTPASADGTNPNPAETIDTTPAAADLAQSLVGPGVSVSNVTYTGDPASRGTFDFSDSTVVGASKGVVLSSGRAADVVGPNVSDWTSGDFTGAGDADLTALAGYDTFDATVLEFDFVPTANQVVFRYAFASDEYPEWVNTPFNDVFAFFVNGQNCAQERQIAGDPAAAFVPVAVNNINDSNPVQDPMPTPMRPDLFRPNYVNSAGGPSPIDLELDGITSVLTCQSPVAPGATNHMKLAIADASDGIYDSAVFIEAGSLVSNDNPVADLSLLPAQGSAPLAVTAVVEGEDPNGAPLSYTIDWGDGSPDSSGDLPGETTLVDHTFTAGGSFLVTLTITNGTHSGTSVDDVDVTGGTPPPPPPPPADTTPPVLAPALSPAGAVLVGATGVTAAANATDDSGTVQSSCDPVDTTSAGTKSLTCTATDGSGNTASATLTYVVGYAVVNVKPAQGATFKRTSSVPVSFQLADANGTLSDPAAAAIRSSTTVAFGSLAPVTPNYSKKTHAFSASLATSKPAPGTYTVTIAVTAGGTVVAGSSITVQIV